MTGRVISKLENILIEIIKFEKQREKRLKENEQHLKDLWDIMKCANICIMGAPKGEERRGQKECLDMMTKSFPNLTKDTNPHTQEAQ